MVQNFPAAHSDAVAALRLDPSNVKGMLRAGKAAMGMGKPDEAQQYLEMAARTDASQAKAVAAEVCVC